MDGHELLNTELLKHAALEFGADLCTVGNIERWSAVPKDESPLSILPRAKSVVCLAFRTQRGALRGAAEGTYFSAYSLANFYDINRVIAPMVQRRVANLLEDHGYESVPVMYYAHNLGKGSGTPTTSADGTEKAAPEVFFNFRTGGYLCGMGEIGYSRMLLTPEFGPAQRLFFVITEAELEADPLVNDICDGCMSCVRCCPAKALEADRCDDITIPGIAVLHRAKLDDTKCRLAHVGGAFSPYAPEEVKLYAANVCEGRDGISADGTLYPTAEEIRTCVTEKVSYASQMSKMFNAPAALCGQCCVMACLAHLDRTGKLRRRPKHPF